MQLLIKKHISGTVLHLVFDNEVNVYFSHWQGKFATDMDECMYAVDITKTEINALLVFCDLEMSLLVNKK